MIEVGLTGGIGSGKSAVGRIFKQLGIPVYISDIEAKIIANRNPRVKEKLQKLFGQDIYTEQGLDRVKLGQIVFSNKEKLSQLNSVIHPAVQEDYEEWKRIQKAPYVIKEAAILIETGGHKKVDKLLVVTAPEELRIQRVMQRDGLKKEEVLARMNNQMPQKEKDALADFLIRNDESESVIKQVLKIHERLLQRTEM